MDSSDSPWPCAPAIAFIGGGHMANALIGGLMAAGTPASAIRVVEPAPERRQWLIEHQGVAAQAQADGAIAEARIVVWAVKPQMFGQAAEACGPFVGKALQLSVMAGIRCAAIQAAAESNRVVRAMPNTPALIGQGMTGLFAQAAVSQTERGWIQELFAPTGRSLWVTQEADLDAVTALSGSGPAYGFFLIEAMVEAALRMGLQEAQGRELAVQTLLGAAMLAQQSPMSPGELRAQVTSKGGTTEAAVGQLQAGHVREAVVRAILAAQARARELGDSQGP